MGAHCAIESQAAGGGGEGGPHQVGIESCRETALVRTTVSAFFDVLPWDMGREFVGCALASGPEERLGL